MRGAERRTNAMGRRVLDLESQRLKDLVGALRRESATGRALMSAFR